MFEQAFKNLDDTLRREAGCTTELDYTEQSSWLLFLKYLDDLEEARCQMHLLTARPQIAELTGKPYTFIIDEPYRWSVWAAPKDKDGKIDHNVALTGDDLRDFVNDKLFPSLQKFKQSAESADTIEYKIGEMFGEIKNKFQSGYNLRDALDEIDELRFQSQDEKHELSHLYEAKIKNMGNAGRNGGEYYTPRPLIRAMIQVIKPQIGERIYDGACGSAGFLCESYEYLRQQKLTTKQLESLQKETLYGKEKKSLAYVIGIMNMILHGIDAPNIIHNFQTSEYWNTISLGISGSAQGGFNASKLSSLIVPIPPLEEQKRIVAILDEAFEGIDKAIENTERNLTNAREIFESYLNSIFINKGDDCVEKKLNEICSIKHGFAFKSEFFTNEENDYILLTPGSFYEIGGYRDQGSKTKYYIGEIPDGFILNKNDMLVVMTEQAVGLLGSTIIVPESNRFLHNQRLGLFQINKNIEWNNDFFFHQFNTHRFRQAVQKTASGVKVRHTSPKKLGVISVYFPPSFSKQQIIADKINNLKEETQRLETIYKRKIEALKELKQSILQKAFTGELTNPTVKKEAA